MAVPDYQAFMLPVLRYTGEHAHEAVAIRDLYAVMAKEFSLTESDQKELLPSGAQLTFTSRVGWACTYMKKAGLLVSPRRGHVQITDAGKQLLADKPRVVNTALLKRFPAFLDFHKAKKAIEKSEDDGDPTGGRTPQELLEGSYQILRAQLASDLLDKVKSCTAAFFERLVIELVVKMGYGGSRADAGKALGRTGDGGVDGIIKEDRLGLDTIYTQAKRWADKAVGRPEVQQFQGALSGHGAVKGIFITTSQFTKEAREYAAGLRNSKIILIDGEELAELMIDFGIGVATAATYEVKRVDSDYFAEEE